MKRQQKQIKKQHQQKLITKHIEKQFNNTPYREQKSLDNKIIVKLYNSKGSFVYLITEAKRQPNGDWQMFGYFREGNSWKWKTVSLYSLQRVNKNKENSITIKRDEFLTSTSVFEEVLLIQSRTKK